MPPPGRLNDSTASPRRERQTARGLPATEPSVLQVRSLQECSNRTRENTCTHTHRHTRNCHGFIQKFQTHYGATNRPFFNNITNRQWHFHTSTSQHAVRTCKYNFFCCGANRHYLQPNPQTTCNMCVPTYFSRSCFQMLVFREGGGGWGGRERGKKKYRKKNIFQKQNKRQRGT